MSWGSISRGRRLSVAETPPSTTPAGPQQPALEAVASPQPASGARVPASLPQPGTSASGLVSASAPVQEGLELLHDEVVIVDLRQARNDDGADHPHTVRPQRERAAVGLEELG